MAINSVAEVVTYNCDGATVRFPITFTYLQDEYVLVKHYNSSTTELFDLEMTTDYAIVDDEVETVSTYPIGDKIYLLLNVEMTQETDLEPNGKIASDLLDYIHDKLTLISQQLNIALNGTLRLEVPENEANLELPSASERAGKVLMFNDNGDLVAVTSIDELTTPVSSYGAALILEVDSEAARDHLDVYSKSEIGGVTETLTDNLAELAGEERVDETVSGNALSISAMPTPVLLEDGEDWTLPSGQSEGSQYKIIAKGTGSSILQTTGQSISYLTSYSTTSGVTGSVDLENKGSIGLICAGSTTSVLDPFVLNTNTPSFTDNVVMVSNADGSYMLVCEKQAAYDYEMYTYRMIDGVLTKYAQSSPKIVSQMIYGGISDDGVYAVTIHTDNVRMRFWKRTANVYTQISFTDPIGNYESPIFMSGDGVYVVRDVGAAVGLYKRTGDTLAYVTTLDCRDEFGLSDLSADSNCEWITACQGSTGSSTVMKRTGDTLAIQSELPSLPSAQIFRTAISGDGIYICIASADDLMFYKRSGDTWSKLTNPAVSTYDNRMCFTEDGSFMVMAYGFAPFMRIYKNIGDVYTLYSDTSPSLTDETIAKFTKDGKYLYCYAQYTDPTEYVFIFNTTEELSDSWQITDYESRSTDISGKFH